MASVPEPSLAELQRVGVYDPADPHARARLELLEYLLGRGAGVDDLLDYRDQLPGLAGVLAIRSGRSLSFSETVERSGVSEEKLLRVWRAAGFAEPAHGARVFTEQFADFTAGLAGAESVFGEEAVLQLVRVMGSAMARLADAIVSAFLINVDPGVSEEDPAGMALARANSAAGALLPVVGSWLETVLRQHLLAARRTSLGLAARTGYETRHLCVGFVDLVDSTALAQQLQTGQLGAALNEFERLATDTVTSGGGRVVKLIGDEILYTSNDEAAACAIALQLAARFSAHPSLPPVRAGLASGEVMMRDGDVFGPVVNLAARAVKVAEPSQVVAPCATAEAAGVAREPLGERQLKGFQHEVALCRLLAAGGEDERARRGRT